MPTATMTSKGQITVPREVRERLGLAAGDRVDFCFEEDGSVQITPLRRSARELYGLLRRPSQKPPSIRQMDRALGDQLAKADERARKSG